MKKYLIIILLSLLTLSCAKRIPENTLELIEKFFKFRNQKNYIKMYNLYHPSYYKTVPFLSFKYTEDAYAKKFGRFLSYKLKRWSYRKNFACGTTSGRMVSIILNCKYMGGETEETFTLIKTGKNEWKIFDYYLKPLVIKDLTSNI